MWTAIPHAAPGTSLWYHATFLLPAPASVPNPAPLTAPPHPPRRPPGSWWRCRGRRACPSAAHPGYSLNSSMRGEVRGSMSAQRCEWLAPRHTVAPLSTCVPACLPESLPVAPVPRPPLSPATHRWTTCPRRTCTWCYPAGSRGRGTSAWPRSPSGWGFGRRWRSAGSHCGGEDTGRHDRGIGHVAWAAHRVQWQDVVAALPAAVQLWTQHSHGYQDPLSQPAAARCPRCRPPPGQAKVRELDHAVAVEQQVAGLLGEKGGEGRPAHEGQRHAERRAHQPRKLRAADQR